MKAWLVSIGERLRNFYAKIPAHKLSRKETACALITAAFFLVIYLLACSHYPSIHGDSPEMVGGSYSLGIMHQPGYPLYTLVGYLVSHIPLGSIAFRVNLLSCIFHAATLFLLGLALVKLTENLAAALVAVAMLGLSYLFFFYSLIAEVFPLNDLFCVLLILMAMLVRDSYVLGDIRRAENRFLLLVFLVGLSLTNHYTVILVFPAIVLLVYMPLASFVRKPRVLLLAPFALLLGVLPYLYIPLRASQDPYMNFTDPSTPRAFLNFVLRKAYGSGRLWEGPAADSRFDLIADYFSVLYKEINIEGIALGLLGMVWMAKKRLGYFIPLFTAFFFSGILFPFLANVKITNSFYASVISRFYLLPTIIFIFFLAMGADAVLRGVGWLFGQVASVAKHRGGLVVSAALIMVLPFALSVSRNIDKMGIDYDYLGQLYVNNLLSGIEEGSVVFLDADIPYELIDGYYRAVENEDKDFVSMVLGFWGQDWYMRHLANHYPDLDLFSPENRPQDMDWDAFRQWSFQYLLEHNPGRSVYVTPALDTSDLGDLPYRLIPKGLVYQFVPRGAEIDYLRYYVEQKNFWNNIDDRGLEATLHPPDSLEVIIAEFYSNSLADVADTLKENGWPGQSIEFYARAFEYYPNLEFAKKGGLALLAAGRTAEAEEVLRFYLENSPEADPAAVEALQKIESGEPP